MLKKSYKKTARFLKTHWAKKMFILVISLIAIFLGVIALWFASIEIPDLQAFQSRVVPESTKIYDRTSEILLYEIHEDVKRTLVPLNEISRHLKNATIAIEDAEFYDHFGIKPRSIIRAVLANIFSGSYAQGGSTLTQQVVKNTILTQDKTITRKLKEWILAIKIEKVLTKNQILEAYLNETPYGGNIYGIEEASRQFFGKNSSDLSLSEAAYLAALPQAPSFYSPYGTHLDRLKARHDLVLQKMLENNFISEEEYKQALSEKITSLEKSDANIKAPHFSLMVKQHLVDTYGEEKVLNGGLRVVTTLDYEIQQKAEKVVNNFAPTLEQNFDAKNIGMVGIDPKTGDILMMIGSKDYYNKEIDGNVNITTSLRQPGSAFKPFVYAAAWNKGYTPDTILFDVETEFNTNCTPLHVVKTELAHYPNIECYAPINYDEIFEGPLTMKKALAQSRNIPAVKTLYLAGMTNALTLARSMGISTLNDPNRYGLTLVLGGGEVTLLDLTSAYGVFATEGTRNAYRSILSVKDKNGEILEEAKNSPEKVLSENITRQISDALSDPKIRISSMVEPLSGIKQQVAAKTGTTNDYKDVWVVGYTGDIVVGAWAGKNDNTPMERKVAGTIITPLWGAFMTDLLKDYPNSRFNPPEEPPDDLKPTLRGIRQGGFSYFADKISGKLATEHTPAETLQEIVFNQVHSILFWVDKDNPRGPIPINPETDSQFENWEYGIRKWFGIWKLANRDFTEADEIKIPNEKDDVHLLKNLPQITFISPDDGDTIDKRDSLDVKMTLKSKYKILKSEIFVNNGFLRSLNGNVDQFSIDSHSFLSGKNTITIIVYDEVYNKTKKSLEIEVR